jgi:hypothetical protein
MDNVPPIHVPSNGKYPVSTILVLLGVRSGGEMLKKVADLKFIDCDIVDEKKFT